MIEDKKCAIRMKSINVRAEHPIIYVITILLLSHLNTCVIHVNELLSIYLNEILIIFKTISSIHIDLTREICRAKLVNF